MENKDPHPQPISRKRFLGLAATAMTACAGAGYVHYEDTALLEAHYRVELSRLLPEHDGFTICQLSDIHNSYHFAPDGSNDLVDLVKLHAPDLIAITGDLIDKRRPHPQEAFRLVKALSAFAPVYFVTGNHERHPNAQGVSNFDLYAHDIAAAGARIIDDKLATIDALPEVCLAGIRDPFDVQAYLRLQSEKGVSAAKGDRRVDGGAYGKGGQRDWYKTLEELSVSGHEKAPHVLLLSHRPERFGAYVKCGFDLVLCGHTHAGQIRLPFIGALFAPNQGWFPRFVNGMYQAQTPHRTYGTTTRMIVSRGIGTSVVPIRTFNRPDVVFISLCKTTGSR